MSQIKTVQVVFTKRAISMDYYANLLDRAMNLRGEIIDGGPNDFGKTAKMLYRDAEITPDFALQVADLQRQGIVDYTRYL